MSDNEYQEEDIDYNPDEYEDMGDQGALNLEDIFMEADNASDIDKFKEVIELERDNAMTHHWSFKSFEKICIIYIKRKENENFTKSFEKLINLYQKVDDCYKIDTVREITYALSDLNDNDFSINILKFMYWLLIEKEVDREVLNTALQLARILFKLEKDEDLGKILDNVFTFMKRLDHNDENIRSMRLEFIIIDIQYLNKINEFDECERSYFEADKLNKEKVIKDNRINAILSEEGGKYLMRQEKYEEALEKFKDAFKSYQDSGDTRTNIILKYKILCYILQRNQEHVIDTEESNLFPDDVLLGYMLDLKKAYDKIDIKKINFILNKKILNEEKDRNILDNFNDIIRNIRINYLCKKLKLYKNISIETIQKDMEIDFNSVLCLLNQICSIKINFMKNYVEANLDKNDEMNHEALKGYNKWINLLS